jgi:hypothetical protein
MPHVAVRRAGAASALLAMALALAALAPTAQANHDKPVALCEEKFAGEFFPFRKYPIRTEGGRRLGRLDVSFQGPVMRRGVRGWRACAVTVLNKHKRLRFANAAVRQADDRRWRSDPGRWRRYAGPVVRWSPYRGNCLIWRGTIRGGSRILKGYCP